MSHAPAGAGPTRPGRRAAHGPTRAVGWGPVGVLILAHALGTLNFTAVLAMAPRVQTALALSRAEVGLLSTAYNAGLLAAALPAGWVVDRYGVRAGLIGAHVLMAVATALLAVFGRTLAVALPCVALGGIGYAVVNPATVKAILLWLPVRLRGTAMGVKQTGVPLGGLLAAATAALSTRVEWTTLLLGIAAATVAGALLCLLAPRAAAGGGPGRSMRLGDVGQVVRNASLTALNAAGAGYNMAQASFTTYLTLFLRDALHAGLPVASACFGLAQAGSTAGRIAWGLVSDRLCAGLRKPPLVAIGLLAAAGLAGLAGLGPGASLALAGALALGLGLTVAAYAGLLQAAAAESVEPRLGGAAIGYNMVFTPLGGMLGPPIFGALVDRAGWYGPAWLTFAGVLLAASLLLARAFRERPLHRLDR